MMKAATRSSLALLSRRGRSMAHLRMRHCIQNAHNMSSWPQLPQTHASLTEPSILCLASRTFSQQPHQNAETQELDFSAHQEASVNPTHAQLVKTPSMTKSLERLGFSVDEIDALAPLEATLVLQNDLSPNIYAHKLPRLVREHEKEMQQTAYGASGHDDDSRPPYLAAEAEELTFSAHDTPAVSVIHVLTSSMKRSLEHGGYTVQQISDMTPLQGALVLQNSIIPPDFAARLPELEHEHAETCQKLKQGQKKRTA